MVFTDSQHQLVLEGPFVDLDGVHEKRIGITNGVIEEISSDAKGERILRLENHLILPGFIDPHAHSRIPGDEHKEDFSTLSRAALHGGASVVLDMPNTRPPASTLDVLQRKRERASRESLVDIEFYALVLPENLHQLESLAPYVRGYKIYVGKSTGGFILPMDYLQHALDRIHATQRPVTIHCEDQEIIDRNTEKYKIDSDPEVHCDIRSPEAEINSIRTVLDQTQIFDRVNIAHLSTAEGLKTVREYKDREYQVACEVTPHHLVLTRDAMKKLDNFGKMNPPLRTEEDRLALIEGLRNGSIDFLATDHAPHTREEKEGSNAPSGVPGLDTYGNVVALLIREYGFTPQQAMKMTSYNAARFFGLGDRKIAVGNRADITVLDLSHEDIVTSDRLYTKCGWSPFEGRTFPGRVTYTIINGRVYDSQNLTI